VTLIIETTQQPTFALLGARCHQILQKLG